MEARHITKIFSSGSIFRRRSVRAVDDVSLMIPKDETMIMTLAGESGSGKSTIARLLLGLEMLTSGEILYRDKNIHAMSKKEKFQYRKEIQAIFQDPYAAYNPFYTARHALSVPIKRFDLAATGQEEQQLIREALEAVHLPPEIAQKYPHELSGGERQRIIIARALIMRPRLIIADEPVSMIDTSLRAGVLNTILELKQKFGISFIYITHDLSTAYYLSDSILVLYRGSIVESGEIEAVLKNPMHPYLQQLIGSIPIPDPESRWPNRVAMRTEEITYRAEERRCKYYGRCPNAKDDCQKEVPPLVPVGRNHYVACGSVVPHTAK